MEFKIVFLCIAGFIGAFVDSIAGGGGLITLPALFMAGVPTHFALGTNKFAATSGSFTSSLKYATSGKVNGKLLKYLIPFTLVGAGLGSYSATLLDEKFLSPFVLVMVLVVGVYTLFSKSIGKEDNFTGLTRKGIVIGIILAFSLGFYDGFFGPGTGSFLMFGFIKLFGFDFINAGGNARVLNFVSNLTALVLFAILGKVDYLLGFPIMISMIIGARVGTKMALNKGVRLIKPIFVTMSLAVAGKMLLEMLK